MGGGGKWIHEGGLQDPAAGLEDGGSGIVPNHPAEVFSCRLLRSIGPRLAAKTIF